MIFFYPHFAQNAVMECFHLIHSLLYEQICVKAGQLCSDLLKVLHLLFGVFNGS